MGNAAGSMSDKITIQKLFELLAKQGDFRTRINRDEKITIVLSDADTDNVGTDADKKDSDNKHQITIVMPCTCKKLGGNYWLHKPPRKNANNVNAGKKDNELGSGVNATRMAHRVRESEKLFVYPNMFDLNAIHWNYVEKSNKVIDPETTERNNKSTSTSTSTATSTAVNSDAYRTKVIQDCFGSEVAINNKLKRKSFGPFMDERKNSPSKEDKTTHKIITFLKLQPGRDYLRHLTVITRKECDFYILHDGLDIMVKVLRCVNKFHFEHALAHLDLKPGNILVQYKGDKRKNGVHKCTLIDFGHAEPFREMVSLQCGTPGYQAPETTKNSFEATSSSDVYSLGVMLLNATFPRYFHVNGDNQACKNFMDKVTGRLKNEGLPYVIQLLFKTVENMAKDNPSDRYTIFQAIDDLDEILNIVEKSSGNSTAGEICTFYNSYMQKDRDSYSSSSIDSSPHDRCRPSRRSRPSMHINLPMALGSGSDGPTSFAGTGNSVSRNSTAVTPETPRDVLVSLNRFSDEHLSPYDATANNVANNVTNNVSNNSTGQSQVTTSSAILASGIFGETKTNNQETAGSSEDETNTNSY